MCIVIDACCGESITNSTLPQSRLLLDWVRGGGKVVSGGLLQEELGRTPMRSLLAQWSASGRLIILKRLDIDAEIARISDIVKRSNDDHLIAIVRLSGANVIVTRDKPLIDDLKNKDVSGGARKIYPMREEPAVNLKINRGVLRNSSCGTNRN